MNLSKVAKERQTFTLSAMYKSLSSGGYFTFEDPYIGLLNVLSESSVEKSNKVQVKAAYSRTHYMNPKQ